MINSIGVDAPEVNKMCNDINKFVERMVEENPETLFISYADHGQVNVKYFDICDYPKLTSMLRRPVGGEKRSTQFFVKPEYLGEFKKMFLELYGNHFELLSKHEMYDQKIFGEGTPHPLFDDMLGDYMRYEDCLLRTQCRLSILSYLTHLCPCTLPLRLPVFRLSPSPLLPA